MCVPLLVTPPHTHRHAPPQEFSDVFPHLVTATDVPTLCKIEDLDFGGVDAGGWGGVAWRGRAWRGWREWQ